MVDVKQFSSDKILKHLNEVHNWVVGGDPPPITVEIDVTNVCNHKCPECVVSYYQKKDKSTLPEELVYSIIDQLSSIGVKGLIFTGGGEPLCCSYTPNAIQYARNHGLDVGLITNGGLITEEVVDTLLRNCTWIRVSLDAANEKMYAITHGSNTREYKNVLCNIRLLTKRKIAINSKCTVGVGYLTSVDTCPSEELFDYLRMIVLGCKVRGVDYIQFRPMQIHRGGDFSYDWYNVTDKIESLMRFSDSTFSVLYSKHKYDMMKVSNFGRDYGKCYGHHFATTICADGKMYVCCHFRGYNKYCIGDLNETTFENIWYSKHRRAVYEGINFKDCIPLCRCNTFNQILWNLRQKKEHVNFL
jgi:MoaA/NifB/PqqE/SkfB family radical SAM enzyme